MSIFSKLSSALKNALTRQKRDQQWGERFDNPPASLDKKLPLDPGQSDLR